MTQDIFNTRDRLVTGSGAYTIYRLDRLEQAGVAQIDHLPFSIRILLESVLRKLDGVKVTRQDVLNLAGWQPQGKRTSMPFFPGRVVMQDFTGVPVTVDLAAMRSALARLGGDPSEINPTVPVDLVIDHSVQVDYYGTPDALGKNAELEFERNRERYEFLHWAQKAFRNLRVVPPATGIVHQVNLEYLASAVLTGEEDGELIAYPDTLVGTDSHTTMINGLGVVGWGVGGIEAISVMVGEPIEMLIPDVIGFKLYGQLPEGVTPTDLTLTITQLLRKKGVVDKFVEFFGPGLSSLSLSDRAMIANMSPENGATITWFPVDAITLDYLRTTGRPESLIELVEAYYRAQGLFREDGQPDPQYTDVIELDLSTVQPSLAGPKRPQDRVPLFEVKESFKRALTQSKSERGYALAPDELDRKAEVRLNGSSEMIGHGAVVIASITSCTNTSNPTTMIGAGLVAKKAVEKGLKVKPYVKTSLAPGSRVVTDYLEKAGLIDPLAKLGFSLVGYGCTTCIGNSGPLPDPVVKAINEGSLVATAVLSGNRNFEGRIHPNTLANYLASPPLVVAYALAGRIDIDFEREPIGTNDSGQPVYLRDIWPTSQEIQETILSSVQPEMFRARYARVFDANETWNSIPSDDSVIYNWDEQSTYIQEPPYFIGMTAERPQLKPIKDARVLAVLGDSVTTDHISPAGAIPVKSPAGQYLIEHGVAVQQFNSYGSRRGNDRVMTRGTFANIRLKNLLVPGVEGGYTVHLPDGEQMSIYDAAMKYQEEGVPLVVIAGREYGTGSSRDWAAKGPLLLGVKAVIAESFERIHRSNLVGMGVLPLQFKPGENAQSLGLTGHETFTIEGADQITEPGSELTVCARSADRSETIFKVTARIDTPIEIEYYRSGGILHNVLYNRLQGK
ncbi:MAG: aconitate hydratase AcnA [Chloroflexi bacterium]|nr:aconitate hydratase AcnA [Chloroflexota bacterium]